MFGGASPAAIRPAPWSPDDGPPPPSRCLATASSARPRLRKPSATRGRAAGQAWTPPWLLSCDRIRRRSSRGVGESPRPRARPSGHVHACSPRGAAVALRLDNAIRVDCAARRLMLACGAAAAKGLQLLRLASPLLRAFPHAAAALQRDGLLPACRRRVRRELSPLLSQCRGAAAAAAGKGGSSAYSPRGIWCEPGVVPVVMSFWSRPWSRGRPRRQPGRVTRAATLLTRYVRQKNLCS